MKKLPGKLSKYREEDNTVLLYKLCITVNELINYLTPEEKEECNCEIYNKDYYTSAMWTCKVHGSQQKVAFKKESPLPTVKELLIEYAKLYSYVDWNSPRDYRSTISRMQEIESQLQVVDNK